MGAKARQDGQMVEAARVYLGGSMGPEPRLADLHHKGVPLTELPDALEALLIEHYGARPRAAVRP
jgi:ferredoxin-nitrite reductase